MLEKQPDHLVTVFAGQDKDATKMREYFGEIPPSSPSMALLKGKEVVHFIHRHEIEGATMDAIITNLEQGFRKELLKKGRVNLLFSLYRGETMIVTTAGRTNKEMIDYAKRVASRIKLHSLNVMIYRYINCMSSMNKMYLS